MLTISPYHGSRNQVDFKSLGGFDVGSSKRLTGTITGALIDEGEFVLKESGKVCPDGIQSSSHFVTSILNRVEELKRASVEKLGEKVDEVIIFTTGRPRKAVDGHYEVKKFSTLYDKDNNCLEHVDYTPVQKALPETKLVILNDMHGAVSAILDKMPIEEIPESGMVVKTGGGFGTGYFKKVQVNGVPHVKISESRDGRREIRGVAMEDYGCNVKSFIRNFCEGVGMDEETIQTYIKKGDTRFVTGEDSEFLANNKYSSDLMEKASRKAVSKYAEGIANCIKLKMFDDGEELNQVFLSGKWSAGIDNFVVKNSELWGTEHLNLPRLIKSYIIKNAGTENMSRIKNLKVSIVSDIKDNTEGAPFLYKKDYKIENELERGRDIVSVYVPVS